MGRISFSGEEKSIDAIWSWYDDQKEALRDLKYKVINAITSSNNNINNKFLTFSLDEINTYFEESQLELEHLVCFNIISATEAHLRIDFYNRVYSKDKTEIGRNFREIFKISGNRVSLEEDIIEKWKETLTTGKKDFGDFIGLLKYRHWLAHGRYWTPKFGQNYNPVTTYDISESIFEIIAH